MVSGWGSEPTCCLAALVLGSGRFQPLGARCRPAWSWNQMASVSEQVASPLRFDPAIRHSSSAAGSGIRLCDSGILIWPTLAV